MTVKGNKQQEDFPVNADQEEIMEVSYQNALDEFEGVPYTYHGILDELDNLKEILRVIGESVIKEEQEFKKIQKEEFDENGSITDRVIDNWYRKKYRPFTYKALILIVQSTFENAIVKLHGVLTEYRRVNFSLKNNYLLDNLAAFQPITQLTNAHMEKARVYNFIRNKLTHQDGFCKTDNHFVEVERMSKRRNDIKIHKLRTPKNGYTHRIEILGSSFINDLLSFNIEVLTTMVRKARKLPELV